MSSSGRGSAGEGARRGGKGARWEGAGRFHLWPLAWASNHDRRAPQIPPLGLTRTPFRPASFAPPTVFDACPWLCVWLVRVRCDVGVAQMWPHESVVTLSVYASAGMAIGFGEGAAPRQSRESHTPRLSLGSRGLAPTPPPPARRRARTANLISLRAQNRISARHLLSRGRLTSCSPPAIHRDLCGTPVDLLSGDRRCRSEIFHTQHLSQNSEIFD